MPETVSTAERKEFATPRSGGERVALKNGIAVTKIVTVRHIGWPEHTTPFDRTFRPIGI